VQLKINLLNKNVNAVPKFIATLDTIDKWDRLLKRSAMISCLIPIRQPNLSAI